MTAEGGDPALIGRTVAGKFVVEKFLGGGAMGAVYRAKQSALDKDVALKVMHRSVAIDPSYVARFHREAKAASRLDHPNSMRVLDFGEEPDGLLYIAMEYLEGRDLYRVIHEDWPLSSIRIGEVLMQALAALAVAHDMGVIHRDLKPENIMILRGKDDDGTETDIVKVCDFGVAKIQEKDEHAPLRTPPATHAGPSAERLTTQGLVVGTPEYMSPEQARGETLDARSDVYSIGVILYQLLTGRTPFMAETPLAVVLKHITEEPAPPRTIYPGVHPRLEAICMKAIAKAKEERYQSAREMRGAIRAAIDARSSRPYLADSTAPPAISSTAATLTEVPTSSSAFVLAASTPTALVSDNISKLMPGEAASDAPSSWTPEPPRRSRATIAIALVALVVGIGGGTALAVAKRVPVVASPPPPTAAPTEAPRDVKPVTPPAPTMSVTEPAPAASHESKPSRRSPLPFVRPSANHAKSIQEPPPPPPPPTESATSVTPPEPPPVVEPPLLSPTTQSFNAALCHAELGSPHALTASNVKDLSLGGAGGAWTSCAQRSLKARPPANGLGATVHLRFSEGGAFKTATCHGCTPVLAQCIASQTRGAFVSLKGEGGSGDAEFEVPVHFVCE